MVTLDVAATWTRILSVTAGACTAAGAPGPATRIAGKAAVTWLEGPWLGIFDFAGLRRSEREILESFIREHAEPLLLVRHLLLAKPLGGDIFVELKRKLRVDEVPNATGALLRVFLELSVDHYMETNNVTTKDSTLAGKVTAVVNHMHSSNLLTEKQAIPVREAVKSPDKVNLATNLNALVHNPDMTVSGTDLKALWTRLERFCERLWTSQEDDDRDREYR